MVKAIISYLSCFQVFYAKSVLKLPSTFFHSDVMIVGKLKILSRC